MAATAGEHRNSGSFANAIYTRIAGISAIFGGLYRMWKVDIGWRVAFISGLM